MSKVNPSFSNEIDITPGPILASTSRFRAAQLDQLGLPFDTASPDVDETPLKSESPADLVARLGQAKALAIAAKHPQRVVIGGDQIALFAGQILGKPGSAVRAEEQLQQFAGNRVTFLTHCTVAARQGRSLWNHTNRTEVTFRNLSRQDITRYVATENPLDCAGGFKIERLGISLFSQVVSDDPSGLIGLPLIFVCRALRHYGFELP